ncbi:MAG TPA: hypothetical protein PKA90_15600 [Ignavibacteria bacterium]|nr:hypothetical protein [Ignavibacteria bacterium]HMR41843.1 hypothetical protein [Ignavibacteria bacterium]
MQIYEQYIWYYLSDVFRYGLKGSELGITNDLIYRIVSFYGGRSPSCEVYAFNENVHENIRGADIDLFIEDNGSGNYYFYMLQAKILNSRGRYLDIAPWSSRSQYGLLIRNARIENATPLYLLYNGYSDNSNLGSPLFGLSIINANIIRIIRVRQRVLITKPKLTFNQLHPHNMNPFHILFCETPIPYRVQNTISGRDIYRGYPYIRINTNNEPEPSNTENDEGNNDNNRNAISIINSNHLAPFRIIVQNDRTI